MIAFEHRQYQSVAGSSTVTVDFTPADGQVINLSEIGASAADESSSRSELLWDATGTPEIIVSTVREVVQRTNKQIIGNGSKILRIKLINNGLTSKTLGAYALGEYA